MSDDIAVTTSLVAFFEESASNLEDDYYVLHGKECDICGDEIADPSEISGQASSISRTAAVQTKSCSSPHIFHKLCLYIWMYTKLHNNEDATYPMCRTKFILSSRSQYLQSFLEELQANVRTYYDMIEKSALQSQRIEAEINRAEQQLQGDWTDEATRLVLLDARKDLIAIQSVVMGNSVRARHHQGYYLQIIVLVEESIALS
jgi:hypothetical protein